MKTSSVMMIVSIVFGAVAVFLTADVCKPYLNQVRHSVPPDVRAFMDKVSLTITQTVHNIFGGLNIVTSSSGESVTGVRVFTKAELKQFDGSDENKPIYLAMLGRVFDVTKGKRHYGVGGGYSFFTGRDGTRAFVTGQFDEAGLVEEVDGLSNREIADLIEWTGFYDKDYTFVGVLHGHYYDSEGEPTTALSAVQKSVAQAKIDQQNEDDDNQRFPPCNTEWSSTTGSRLWCSDKSGGIEREWIGVPRIYKKSGQGAVRCACVRTFGPPSDGSDPSGTRGDLDDPHFKEYEGCEPDLPSCKLITK